MAIRLGQPVTVLATFHGERLKAEFRPYADDAMKRALHDLIFNRIGVNDQTGTPMDQSSQARCRFFDAACLSIEGLEDRLSEPGPDGEEVWAPLDKEHFADWLERVPDDIKASFALAFEENRTLSRQEKNGSRRR